MEKELTAADYRTIRTNELFKGLDEAGLSFAMEFFRASVSSHRKGECLHRVGSRLIRFGLVLSGRVQVCMDDIDGNPIIMASVTAGRTFGESLCFLEIEEEPVTISAATDVKVLWLRTDSVRQKTGLNDMRVHDLLMRFITLITSRALSMNDRIQILSKKSLRGKLIVFFSQCVHQFGSHTFELPFNRDEMASYLGTNRSALSRELTKMKQEGILDFSREKFHILKGDL